MNESTPTRLTLLTMVAAPALMLAGHLAQASPTAHDTASELASIADQPDRYQVAALLGFVALVLYVPAVLGLAAPVRTRRPRVAIIGSAMSVAGVVALASLMGSGPMSLAMADDRNREAMIRVTDAYESSALVGVWGMLMMLGFSLGPVVLGVARWRIGGTAWVPALLLAAVVVQAADAGRWPLAAGFALTVAGFAVAGLTSVDVPRRRAAAAVD